jgi:peptidoglycan/LPS O-acetylase OafA/YrhL
VGTLYFNVSTGNAMRVDLTAQAANQHVWRPDAVGSVCFLVASALAWFEVCHGWAGWRPRSWSWWITLANLVGSVAFGVSAVAGYINPATGQLHNAERSNLGTLAGAVCFFVGALLLLPERTGDVSDATAPVASDT